MFFIIVIRSFYIFLFKLRKTILLIHVSGTCSQIWHDIILKENTYNLNKRRNYVLIALYMIICSALFKVKSQSILLLFFFLKKKLNVYTNMTTPSFCYCTQKNRRKNGPQPATDSHLKLPCHVGFCRCVVDCAII